MIFPGLILDQPLESFQKSLFSLVPVTQVQPFFFPSVCCLCLQRSYQPDRWKQKICLFKSTGTNPASSYACTWWAGEGCDCTNIRVSTREQTQSWFSLLLKDISFTRDNQMPKVKHIPKFGDAECHGRLQPGFCGCAQHCRSGGSAAACRLHKYCCWWGWKRTVTFRFLLCLKASQNATA